MKYFAIICLLTIASATQSTLRHTELDIYKRTVPRPEVLNRPTSPNRQREKSPERTKSPERKESSNGIKSMKSLGSINRQGSRPSSPRSEALQSRPEASHSGRRVDHSPFAPLRHENPVQLPSPQASQKSRPKVLQRDHDQRLNAQEADISRPSTPGIDLLRLGSREPLNPGRSSLESTTGNGLRATARTDTHNANGPATQEMSRTGNPSGRTANSVVSWAERNPTTAAFGGCALAGGCLAAAGVGMIAASAGAAKVAGVLVTGIGGGLSLGTTAVAGGAYYSGIDGSRNRSTGSSQSSSYRTAESIGSVSSVMQKR